MKIKNYAGFTLIELMITVAVIAILASIAYPSYQEYIRRGNRAEARAILLENAQILERNYTTASRYDAVNSDGSGGAPAIIAQSPKPASTAKYNIASDTTTRISGACTTAGQCFTLTATATGVMTADGCGNLSVDDTGARNATGGLGTAACWER